MPIFIAALWGALLNVLGTVVGRVLVHLGIAAVTYTGLTASLDWLRDNAVSQLNAVPPQVLAVLSIMKVGSALSLIVSATTARFVLSGMSAGGSLRAWKK